MVSNAIEWLDKNMACNYPIADRCTAKSKSGIYLPSSFLVDASIMITGYLEDTAEQRFFISDVICSADYVEVCISYRQSPETRFECARTERIPLTTRSTEAVEDRTFRLVPAVSVPEEYADLQSISGSVIIGSCSDILSTGLYAFEYDEAQLLSTCIYRVPSGIRNITVIGADSKPVTISDDFILRAGDGIDIQCHNETDAESGDTLPVVTISRIPTEAELAAEIKTVEDAVAAIYAEFGAPIRSINGVLPGDQGDITISGDDCTQVIEVANGITFANPCAKPCCGDTQSPDITAALQSLSDARDRLMQYFESMSTNINAMQSRLSSLIASRG